MLKRIAREIAATVRTSDQVFRFGGEEFVLICDGLSAAPALALGERLRREIAGGSEGGAAASVTVSVGIATCDAQCRDYDAMFHRADQRLYQAKAQGRNCVVGDRAASAEGSVRLAYSG